MFHWERGHSHCAKSMVIAPFWFSTEHHWTVLTPAWLLAHDIYMYALYGGTFFCIHLHVLKAHECIHPNFTSIHFFLPKWSRIFLKVNMEREKHNLYLYPDQMTLCFFRITLASARRLMHTLADTDNCERRVTKEDNTKWHGASNVPHNKLWEFSKL